MTKGFSLWFTGMSGSGKSTLANLVADELRKRGHLVEVLDGDEIRTHLSKGLGFSKEDRDTNIRRIGYVAKLLSRNGVVADVRDELRREHQRFFEVFMDCTIEKLSERDVKGLYKKALAGEIKNFTGISDPYEPPHNPDLVIDSGKETVEESFKKLIAKLEEVGYINPAGRPQ
jgi:adenylyl-sulfate kinase